MKHRFLTIAGLGLLIATASATAVVLARPATAADTLPEASPYTITTTGQGVVVAATDQARVVLAVEAQAATIPAAHSKATEVAAAVRAALRGQGVAEEDIHVLHYYTGPRPASGRGRACRRRLRHRGRHRQPRQAGRPPRRRRNRGDDPGRPSAVPGGEQQGRVR